jgi:hypothetical protein
MRVLVGEALLSVSIGPNNYKRLDRDSALRRLVL